MTSKLRRAINRLGWDVRKLSLSSSDARRIVSAVKKVNANLVFDVGANAGQFAQDLRFDGYDGDIVSFEPLTVAHSKLFANAAGDPRWTVHPRTAIGDHEGSVEINISGNSVSSSILPMLDAHASAAPNSAYVSKEAARLCRLDDVAGSYISETSTTFLKIDTQGFEWQVLDGAEKVLESTCGIVCELSLLPLYDGQRLWRDLVDRLESSGLVLWAILPGYVDPRDGRSLQFDAIFLRVANGG